MNCVYTALMRARFRAVLFVTDGHMEAHIQTLTVMSMENKRRCNKDCVRA